MIRPTFTVIHFFARVKTYARTNTRNLRRTLGSDDPSQSEDAGSSVMKSRNSFIIPDFGIITNS